jgi:ankyrin repeat protein
MLGGSVPPVLLSRSREELDDGPVLHKCMENVFPDRGGAPIWRTDEDALAAAKYLIEEIGVPATRTDICTQYALHWSAKYPLPQTCEYLCERMRMEDPSCFMSVDHHGQTPLHYAASNNRPEVISVLLRYGWALEVVDTCRGWTPLMWAAEKGHMEALRCLIENGSGANSITRARQLVIDEWKKARDGNTKSLLEQCRKFLDGRTRPEPEAPSSKRQKYLLVRCDTANPDSIWDCTEEDLREFEKLFPNCALWANPPSDEVTSSKLRPARGAGKEWTKQASHALRELSANPMAGEFKVKMNNPASLGLHDYLDVVAKPMDLNSIQGNLKAHRYQTLKQFCDDVDIVFSNCLDYWTGRQGGERYVSAAVGMQKFWLQTRAKHLPPDA